MDSSRNNPLLCTNKTDVLLNVTLATFGSKWDAGSLLLEFQVRCALRVCSMVCLAGVPGRCEVRRWLCAKNTPHGIPFVHENLEWIAVSNGNIVSKCSWFVLQTVFGEWSEKGDPRIAFFLIVKLQMNHQQKSVLDHGCNGVLFTERRKTASKNVLRLLATIL